MDLSRLKDGNEFCSGVPTARPQFESLQASTPDPSTIPLSAISLFTLGSLLSPSRNRSGTDNGGEHTQSSATELAITVQGLNIRLVTVAEESKGIGVVSNKAGMYRLREYQVTFFGLVLNGE